MANRALVVGCDAYPGLKHGDLRGAVADALAVRDWLLLPDGGCVAENDLILLASCSTHGAQPGSEVAVTGPAERKIFAKQVKDLVEWDGASEDDRLFVYLAGHGCRTDPLNPMLAQDAFAFTGFCADDPQADCAGIEDLKARLRLSRFGVVVVVVDACRNFPFGRPFPLAQLGFDPELPRDRSYEPCVYLIQATLPGRTAVARLASETAGMVRGDFTVALLDGLRGKGSAKIYDERLDRPYVVWLSRLARFVEEAVPRQPSRPVYEGDDLVLATFPDSHFDDVTLTVQVVPHKLGQADDLRVNVSYCDPSAGRDPTLEGAGPAPVEFTVPPRRQEVVALAGHTRGKRCWFDVYADMSVEVPLQGGGPQRRVLRIPGRPGDDGGTMPGAVRVETDDPAAVLRVQDHPGHTVVSGVGSAGGRLEPGPYTALLVDGTGRQHAEIIDVDAGTEAPVRILAPVPAAPLAAAGPAHERLGLAPLRFASDAAALGWQAIRRDHRGRFALAIAGTGPRPRPRVILHAPKGRADRQMQEFGTGHQPWWGFVLPHAPDLGGPGWFTIYLAGHSLTVPALPGAGTTVALGPDRLSVALFDHDVLASEDALALMDRSQSLLGAGERDAASAVLDQLTRLSQPPADAAGPVAALLETAANPVLPGALTVAVAPGDAPYLLPTGPWAVFADLPTATPAAATSPLRVPQPRADLQVPSRADRETDTARLFVRQVSEDFIRSHLPGQLDAFRRRWSVVWSQLSIETLARPARPPVGQPGLGLTRSGDVESVVSLVAWSALNREQLYSPRRQLLAEASKRGLGRGLRIDLARFLDSRLSQQPPDSRT
jgi:Caspase domain